MVGWGVVGCSGEFLFYSGRLAVGNLLFLGGRSGEYF